MTVIGAGIVGLTSAAALVRAGWKVTVIDAGPGVANGASRGNGCQLSYGYVAPLAQPSLLPELPQLLFAGDAPLALHPRLDIAQWRWMTSFLAACRRSVARRGALELLALGQRSREQTELWIEGSDAAALAFGRHGKLVLLPDAAAMATAQRQVDLQAGCGPEQQMLSEMQCLQIEPSLAAFRGRIAGAVYTPSECVVDSHALCIDLEQQLVKRGVTFKYETAVAGFDLDRRRISRIHTAAGTLPIDCLVLANGVGSAQLGRNLGIRIPVEPIKGYSITVPVTDVARAPTVSITDSSRKIVYARVGSKLRVAGMAELGTYDLRINPARVDQLINATRHAFGDSVNVGLAEAWVGLRPATPDSVPLIGRSPEYDNLYLNVGQGALGLTLAFGSADRLALAMTSLDTSYDKSRTVVSAFSIPKKL
ncbi:D-amino acid dehydrogenase [uncultured Xylophilus sp.]|uniref:D-amino acid dehydrogenase n=1 Tax=uncultured Xylophilus sp. TaxID=296832 RepID=UPI0025E00E35|nr:D-amino acid dehydrogenase [uncultured Xylophilus sp.]